MDPNLFHIDWEQLLEVLVVAVVLSFVVERALALVFEHRYFIASLHARGLKEPIAFATAFVMCWYWDFDLISVILKSDATSMLGVAFTAAVIAGGSKASVKLFHDLLDVRSAAQRAKEGGAK